MNGRNIKIAINEVVKILQDIEDEVQDQNKKLLVCSYINDLKNNMDLKSIFRKNFEL